MSYDIVKTLSKRLKQERLRLNLSQETVAQRAGVSRNFIGMIERAERNPTVAILDDIAKAIGLDTWELLKS